MEGSKKVMGVWFAGEVVGQGPNNIPETSKVKQFNLEGILKILDRLDDKEDDKI
ncbi:MAG: hypothetical protein LBC61_06945 [Candidatus Peribacteria bacterium]|nr:hypothetical protein [Candidatus Peribacteria bacterium]